MKRLFPQIPVRPMKFWERFALFFCRTQTIGVLSIKRFRGTIYVVGERKIKG